MYGERQELGRGTAVVQRQRGQQSLRRDNRYSTNLFPPGRLRLGDHAGSWTEEDDRRGGGREVQPV